MRAWLLARLGQAPGDGEGSVRAPQGPLAAAAQGVVEAAGRYQRAAKAEVEAR